MGSFVSRIGAPSLGTGQLLESHRLTAARVGGSRLVDPSLSRDSRAKSKSPSSARAPPPRRPCVRPIARAKKNALRPYRCVRFPRARWEFSRDEADFNRLAANFGLCAAGATVTRDDWVALAR